MKDIRKFSKVSVSAVLLLSFSLTFLPLDIFHQHTPYKYKTSCTKNNNHSCDHKIHLKSEGTHCRICAVHHDKKYTLNPEVTHLIISSKVFTWVKNEILSSIKEVLFSHLRGPPVTG